MKCQNELSFNKIEIVVSRGSCDGGCGGVDGGGGVLNK